ncbi:MAG: hypothetical protein U0932_10910 [Thiobacillus sp.]|nr:hypothetical protein [Thiobacillus sp.]
MPGLQDNLRRWRDAAEIDWFSQFIKAWIPFNAWMTDTYGDLTDRELLDKVKDGHNVVYNRVVPMLTRRLPQARDVQAVGWRDDNPEAQDFRLQIAELHRLLQSCEVEGRRGRVSFETVDIGANSHKDEQRNKWRRDFRVRRDHPTKGEITLEITATRTSAAFSLTLPQHDRRQLEDAPTFQALRDEQRSTLLDMFEMVAPRRIITVLAPHGHADVLAFGDNVGFINDPTKVFSAMVDVIYNLRNALFHGAITPNETHNAIYEPAYHIVMRCVRCTV